MLLLQGIIKSRKEEGTDGGTKGKTDGAKGAGQTVRKGVGQTVRNRVGQTVRKGAHEHGWNLRVLHGARLVYNTKPAKKGVETGFQRLMSLR